MVRQHLLALFIVLLLVVPGAAGVASAQTASPQSHQSVPAAPSTPGDPDRADALFMKGKAAAQAKRWNEAHQLLAEAWQLKQSYDIASNLGQVAYLLGNHAEAAQHVAFALRHYPATGDAEQKQKAQNLLEMARQKVSSLSVHVTPGDADVLIDGTLAGRAASLPPELFVEPGERTVSARLGGERVQRELTARAGKRYRLELTLAESAATPAATAIAPTSSSMDPADAEPPSTAGLEPRYIALIVGGGLTVASGVALGVYTAKRSRAESDLDTYRARVEDDSDDPNHCATSTSEACRDLAQTANDWETYGRARDVFLVTTVALGAGTLATFLFWPADPAPTVSLTPVVHPRQPGVVLSGSF